MSNLKTTICKQWSFDAAHQLPNHDGKCRQPHGHTYSIRVCVRGEPRAIDGQPQEGMVLDFGRLNEIWKRIEPVLDHQDLNQTLSSEVPRTTSELLAGFVWRYFQRGLTESSVELASVRVSETQATYAEVTA